ncbi:hypothetical protein JCM1841_003221 [Sporobolomyces salmonicolor]
MEQSLSTLLEDYNRLILQDQQPPANATNPPPGEEFASNLAVGLAQGLPAPLTAGHPSLPLGIYPSTSVQRPVPFQPVPSSFSTQAIPVHPSTSFPQPRYDSNSFEDFLEDSSYSFGTPSYVGSWASSQSFGAASPAPSDIYSNPSSYNEPTAFDIRYQQAQQLPQQLPFDPVHNQFFAASQPADRIMPSDAAFEGDTRNTGGSAEDGRRGSAPERDLTLIIPRRSGSGGYGTAVTRHDTQRPYAYKRSSSGFSSYLNYAASPTERTRPATPAYSATRSTVFEGSALSDSPPTSTVPLFHSAPAPVSAAPSLTPLEIPNTPCLSLTGPTPETARPRDRPKGRGTLELERVLGMWAAKTPTSTFPSLPPLSSAANSAPPATQPLFAQTIVSAEPESFDPAAVSTSISTSTSAQPDSFGGTPFSSLSTAFPDPNPASSSTHPPQASTSQTLLAPPRSAPRRQRSKSETDIIRVDSMVFSGDQSTGAVIDSQRYYPSLLSVSPLQLGASDLSQSAMNPNDAWHPPTAPPASFLYTTGPPVSLSFEQPQHELASRTRPPSSHNRRGGGPGYHEAALLDAGSAAMGHQRRARSQGAGHRSSKSDDFSHLFSSSSDSPYAPHQPPPQLQTSADGMLAPYGSNLQTASPPAQHQAYPQQLHTTPAYGQHDYAPSQAALMASATLVAFNPPEGSHTGSAHYLPAGYSHPNAPPVHHPPPLHLSQFPPHSYSHHHHPVVQYASPRPASVHSAHSSISGHSSTRGSIQGVSSRDPSPAGRPSPPAYFGSQRTPHVYHSPMAQGLPSPPQTQGPGGRSVSPAESSSHRAQGVKLEEEDGEDEDEDEDEAMEDVSGEDDGGYGSPETSATETRGKGRIAAKGKGRARRQVSEEQFTKESKTTQATIEAAKRRRNANAVAKFVCELCGETFTRRYNLRGHQRAHAGEKPYKCSYEGCDKAFARAHDCKRHELLHLGVRKYHCSPCKRDFVRLDALHRHHRSEVGQACVRQLEAEGFVFDEKGAVAL